MKKTLRNLATAFLITILGACGGGSSSCPPVTANPLTTPAVIAAQQQLQAALQQCGSSISGGLGNPAGLNAGGCGASPVGSCMNDLTVAYLQYKTALLANGQPATNNPFYVNVINKTFIKFGQNFIQQNGIPPIAQLGIAAQLNQGFNQCFGQGGGIDPASLAQIQGLIPTPPVGAFSPYGASPYGASPYGAIATPAAGLYSSPYGVSPYGTPISTPAAGYVVSSTGQLIPTSAAGSLISSPAAGYVVSSTGQLSPTSAAGQIVNPILTSPLGTVSPVLTPGLTGSTLSPIATSGIGVSLASSSSDVIPQLTIPAGTSMNLEMKH